MKICWVIFAQVSVDNRTGKLTSPLASLRYRCIMPAYQLADSGIASVFCYVDESVDINTLQNVFDSDIIVFNKSFCKKNEELAKAAKARGIKIVLDLSDHYFADPEYSAHYLSMAALADTIVVPTDTMAKVVAQYTGKKAVIIADPYEGEQQPAKYFRHGDRLKLLWFGHCRGLEIISNEINDLVPLSHEIPLELTLVTAFVPDMFGQIESFNACHDRYFKLRFVPWSLQSLEKCFEETDLVIIPSKQSAATNVKSNNRLVASLWAGRFAIANHVPSYEEFSQSAWIGDSIAEGIQWALENPKSVVKRIEQAQREIASRYSPGVLGEQWRKLMSDVVETADALSVHSVFDTEAV